MTLGDLYPDVRLYSEVETIIMTRGRGWSGRDIWGEGGGRWEEGVGGTYGKGRRGRRWQGDDPICCSSVGVSSVT